MSESKDTKDKEVKKDDTAVKPVAKTGAKKPMPKGVKIALIVAVAFVGFIVAVFMIAYSATSGAVKVSDEFINALQAGDGTTAYSLLSSDVKGVEFNEDEFVAFVDQVGPTIDTEESKVSQEVSSNDGVDTGLVIYEITDTSGTELVIGVTLIQEDDGWRVSELDIEQKEDE